jgi:hypothetical protein
VLTIGKAHIIFTSRKGMFWIQGGLLSIFKCKKSV